MMKEKLELIGTNFKGDKNLWFDFTNHLRKTKKLVWTVIRPAIIKELKKKKKEAVKDGRLKP